MQRVNVPVETERKAGNFACLDPSMAFQFDYLTDLPQCSAAAAVQLCATSAGL